VGAAVGTAVGASVGASVVVVSSPLPESDPLPLSDPSDPLPLPPSEAVVGASEGAAVGMRVGDAVGENVQYAEQRPGHAMAKAPLQLT
jgi:hypothetical protein